jgi:hypothetical protein
MLRAKMVIATVLCPSLLGFPLHRRVLPQLLIYFTKGQAPRALRVCHLSRSSNCGKALAITSIVSFACQFRV